MTDLRLAVLIDADNVPYSHIKEMLEEIAKSGTPTIKRITPIGHVLLLQGGKMFYLKTQLRQFSNTVIQPERIQATALL